MDAGTIWSIVGAMTTFAAAFWGAWEAHDQRRKKDKTIAILSGPLHEARGHLIRSKVTAPKEEHKAIDDGIGRIDQALAKLPEL